MLGLIERRMIQGLDASLATVLKTTTTLSPRLTVPAVQTTTLNLRTIFQSNRLVAPNRAESLSMAQQVVQLVALARYLLNNNCII